MNLLDRKQNIREDLLSVNNSVQVSLKKLENFCFKHSIWAVYMPLKDEPTLIDFPKDVKLCFPKAEPSDLSMNFLLGDLVKAFSKSSLGVKEPIKGEVITKDQINVMLIPGVAFDTSGNRLGRGKGYYDRYLKDYKGVKIGVCSKARFLDFPLPIDSNFDVKVDYILTEDFIYQPIRAEKHEKVV